MALLRFLLLIIFLYLIFRFVFRLILGYNQRKNFYTRTGNQYSSQKKDGQITVNLKSSSKKKKIPKDEGEYIKYEEIKEKDKS